MPKNIQLNIPTPCHEDWSKMTPADKGKFCGSCQKQVVDFTNMSDRQVAEFFKKPSTGSVCGRFMSDQLERDMEIPKKRIPFVKYFFQIALPAFLFSLKTSAQRTQNKPVTNVVKPSIQPSQPVPVMMGGIGICRKPVTGDTIVTPEIVITAKTLDPVTKELPLATSLTQQSLTGWVGMVSVDKNQKRELTGLVTDETGMIMPGVTVRIKGKHASVTTDMDGRFHINAREGDILVTSAVFLEPAELVVDASDSVVITVKRIVIYNGEVIITSSPGIQKRKKTIPLITQTVKDTMARVLKTFPNPVKPGTSLTIEWKQEEQGYYALQLIDQSGQAVHQKEIWIDAEARSLSFEVPTVAAGNYYLVFINKNTGRKMTENIVIQ